MSPRVLVATQAGSRRFAEVAGSPLDGRADVRHVEWPASLPDRIYPDRYRNLRAREWFGPEEDRYNEAFDRELAQADALVAAPWSWACVPAFDERRWEVARRLKVIAGTFDHRFHGMVDVAEAARRGVAVVDTSRSMTPTVAEFALAMTLNLLRDIPAAVQAVREGRWKEGHWDVPGFVHGDLHGRSVGLAGYGTINRRYAELVRPFRCRLRAYDPHVPGDRLLRDGVDPVSSLVELAARSEILVVGVPPTPATEAAISREVIDALPSGALLILVTRMFVVDQEALWRRAEAGGIRVAVDVFDPEPPPPDAPFRRLPAVLPTPHIAGDTTTCHRRCFTTACADALAVLDGGVPRYGVTVQDDLLYRGALA
jgi:phosphoglycerate dehydrogenase-like enzyme